MTIDDLHSNMVSWDELANDYIRHTAEIAKLRAALEQVEYVGIDSPRCPWCGLSIESPVGHKPGCARQLALNGGAK